ncbi:HAD superfamily hydrolase (TIGR01509 family) [Streptosporangium album]|uniref:HAD superfamily hydrolase (TIGR01509 family) n=1 Tax=Streptosporangium album TaxID=47479 RepID=A0A7W7RQV4_9ACTN|nr:HAD family phosphatase [Streptosporangium album]MBB4936483.1 HAD superfamily hydrolase (TIGR01509 family) [Streptosporangium album]
MSAEAGPRAVLFDMDGTLVDTEGLWWEACAAVAAELGLDLTEADTTHVLGRPIERTAAHLVRRSARRDGPFPDAEDIAECDRLSPDAETVGARLTEAFAERIARGVTPLPGAIRLLDELGAAGVPVALVSASPRRIVDMVLRTVGAQRFRTVVAAEDTARAKPLPDPYLKAAAALGARPAECVAVEDSPTGLAAARAAGCQVVAVAGGTAVPYGVLSVGSLEKVDLTLLRLLTAGKISVS